MLQINTNQNFLFYIPWLLVLSNLLLQLDCSDCASKFADNSGCQCIKDTACNKTALFPFECFSCGVEIINSCNSGIGNF